MLAKQGISDEGGSTKEGGAHHPQLLFAYGDDLYVNVVSDETVRGHPTAAALLPRVRGMQIRQGRRGPRPIESWLQFADAATGLPYYADLKTGARSTNFPRLSFLTLCVLPPRSLELSAQQLALAGSKLWGGLSGEELLRTAKTQIW